MSTLASRFTRASLRMEQAWLPEVRYSQEAYEELLLDRVDATMAWLDLGCGRHLLPPWQHASEARLLATARTIVGIDADLPSLIDHATLKYRCNADIRALPFHDASFELVTANMVFEHLDAPERQLIEVNRVLRPNGLLVLRTPNAWGYPTLLARYLPSRLKRFLARVLEDREADDVFPTFYRANTRRAFERLARNTGFCIDALTFVETPPVFRILPPVASVEILWLRLLKARLFEQLRPNLLVTLRKVATF